MKVKFLCSGIKYFSCTESVKQHLQVRTLSLYFQRIALFLIILFNTFEAGKSLVIKLKHISSIVFTLNRIGFITLCSLRYRLCIHLGHCYSVFTSDLNTSKDTLNITWPILTCAKGTSSSLMVVVISAIELIQDRDRECCSRLG